MGFLMGKGIPRESYVNGNKSYSLGMGMESSGYERRWEWV